MHTFLPHLLIIVSLLVALSVIASKAFSRIGVPSLILFLGLGMLAGSEGLGKIYFDNYSLAQSIGILSLILILFSGGMESNWKSVRPIVKNGLLLATLGVAITAALVAVFAKQFLQMTWPEGLLLGATVSSTDAAAVFGVLRSKGIRLKHHVNELLEFESGCNDPMAVFLTVALVQYLGNTSYSLSSVAGSFVTEMVLGAALGFGMGRASSWLINKLNLESEGLYPVLTLSLATLTYAGSSLLHGNGFLAVYVAGLTLGNTNFIKKRTIKLFHDGLAWLVQIMMFLTLGLLVNPSQLAAVWIPGTVLALFLVLLARPAAVWLSLGFSKLDFKQKTMVSWVGLRGAVPIILATYPMSAHLSIAHYLFNLVFFVVVVSVVLQGTLINFFAKRLQMSEKYQRSSMDDMNIETARDHLIEIKVEEGSIAVGKTIVDLKLPKEALVVLVQRPKGRKKETIVPKGGTELIAGDILVMVAEAEALVAVQALIQVKKIL